MLGKASGLSGSRASQLVGGRPYGAITWLYDPNAAEGVTLRSGVSDELVGPLAGKYRVVLVNAEATSNDASSLGERNTMIAMLGKGGESKAMDILKASGMNVDEGAARALISDKFSRGGGATFGHIAFVPLVNRGLFEPNDTLLRNLTVHEFGHSISRRGQNADHATEGVMHYPTEQDAPILHFTPDFLRQFE
jgi:hypothetical protein